MQWLDCFVMDLAEKMGSEALFRLEEIGIETALIVFTPYVEWLYEHCFSC